MEIVLDYDINADVVYNFIEVKLKEGVSLSFENIEIIDLNYFSELFTKLYSNHTSEFLNKHLKLTNISGYKLTTINRILQNSKQFTHESN